MHTKPLSMPLFTHLPTIFFECAISATSLLWTLGVGKSEGRGSEVSERGGCVRVACMVCMAWIVLSLLLTSQHLVLSTGHCHEVVACLVKGRGEDCGGGVLVHLRHAHSCTQPQGVNASAPDQGPLVCRVVSMATFLDTPYLWGTWGGWGEGGEWEGSSMGGRMGGVGCMVCMIFWVPWSILQAPPHGAHMPLPSLHAGWMQKMGG